MCPIQLPARACMGRMCIHAQRKRAGGVTKREALEDTWIGEHSSGANGAGGGQQKKNWELPPLLLHDRKKLARKTLIKVK